MRELASDKHSRKTTHPLTSSCSEWVDWIFKVYIDSYIDTWIHIIMDKEIDKIHKLIDRLIDRLIGW